MSNSLLEASGWGEVKGGDEISTGFTNEYEEFNEQDHYGSISYAKEELKAEAISTRYSRSEPPDLDIAVTAQSTFVPLQLKDCWKKKSCTAVLLALAGGCLLLSIVLFSQAVFSELRKLNTRISSQESVDPSTISRMIQELNSSLITELRILEERISKRSEATDKNVSKQISRLEENMKSSLRDLKGKYAKQNADGKKKSK
ncbi:hypothetical protein lerEdw1_006076 [Lerista edwardsae]|nr:hypothetical protein lerEdw1_006076 [Lerista edwardsae]